MNSFLQLIKDIFLSAVSMLNSASPWMIFSFAVAGIIHEFVGPEKMKKSAVGSKSIRGLITATITGMIVPICSCGTIPLGISMYYSGAYLGPVLTFMTSGPMINPIAVILAFGLLGKEITIIYLISGFVGPLLIGIIANSLAGDELYYRPAYEAASVGRMQLQLEQPTVTQKIMRGLKWSFTELAKTIGKYTVSGMLIAGTLFSVVPQTAIQRYLGDPGMVSLLGITAVAALMYVCAVGHIPFIAALVASGAAPGVAATFLMAGCATNIAELINIRKLIGKRAVILYSISVIILSEITGYVTNVLLPDFEPVLNYDAVTHSISNANKLIIEFPGWLANICTAVIFAYALAALVGWIREQIKEND